MSPPLGSKQRSQAGIDNSVQLAGVGTYIFTESIAATAGNTPGFADVMVDVTLEDEE